MDVAIIGAGMAGLACATRLNAAGHRVRLFDKGRGPVGRMAARRVEIGGTWHTFDHGAQYFTARNPRFAAQVAWWAEQELTARWDAAGPDAWVGTPAMNAPIRALAEPLDVTWNCRIEQLGREDGRWRVDGADAGLFDALVVAIPAEQAAALMNDVAPLFAAAAAKVPSLPCWTLMAAFAEPLPLAFDIIRGEDQDALSRAARDSAKSGRGPGERWVVQAGAQWSRRHLEDESEAVAAALLAALEQEAGVPLPPPQYQTAHRWRYARTTASKAAVLWDEAARIGACGDWCRGARAEGAWLAGDALAGTMLEAI